MKTFFPLLLVLAFGAIPAVASDEDYARYTLRVASSAARPSGAFVLLDGDGRRRIEGQLADGQLDGLVTFYTSRGSPLAEITFARGDRSGPFTLFYSGLGNISTTGRKLHGAFRNGREDGVLTSWNPDGKRRSERTLAEGKLLSARAWSPDNDAEAPAAVARAQALKDAEADDELFRTLDHIAKEAIMRAHRQEAAPGQ